GEYISRNRIMPLNEFVDSKQIDLTNFDQNLIDVGVMNDQIYMVTYGTTTTALYYNKTLLDEIGVTLPEAMSWDEFKEKAAEIQALLPKGVWAVEDNGGSGNAFNHFLATQNKDFYTQDGQLSVRKEDLIEYFQMWDEIRKD